MNPQRLDWQYSSLYCLSPDTIITVFQELCLLGRYDAGNEVRPRVGLAILCSSSRKSECPDLSSLISGLVWCFNSIACSLHQGNVHFCSMFNKVLWLWGALRWWRRSDEAQEPSSPMTASVFFCLFQIPNLVLFLFFFFSFTTALSPRQSIFGSPKNEGIEGGMGQRKCEAISVRKGAATILDGSHHTVRKQRLLSKVIHVPLCWHMDSSSGHLESTGAHPSRRGAR